MIDPVKEFKEELAVLLEKYNCELTAVSDARGWDCGTPYVEADFGEPISKFSVNLGNVFPYSLRRDG